MDPFFEYFKRERTTVSQNLYGSTPPYKEYPRKKRIALPTPESTLPGIANLLAHRTSTRSFAQDSLPLSTIGSMLYWSLGLIRHEGEQNRPQPSGGAKYPIEAYLIVRSIEDLSPGVYHYNVPGHHLELLSEGDHRKMIRAEFGYPFVEDAAAILCLTFVKSRSMEKYGGFAYKLGLIEAGHIGQNVYLLSRALQIGCCSLGGGDTETMHETLGIDGGNEHFTYGIALGVPS